MPKEFSPANDDMIDVSNYMLDLMLVLAMSGADKNLLAQGLRLAALGMESVPETNEEVDERCDHVRQQQAESAKVFSQLQPTNA